MAILSTIGILVVTILVSEVAVLEQKSDIRTYYDAICNNVTKDPFFEDKAVIGKPWRVYFTWNMQLDEYCLEFTFKYADKLTVSRLKFDVESMKIKPTLSKEVLLISMIASPDMLLFNDLSGIPGLFVGMIYDTVENKKMPKKPHKMAMKLLHKGQYLLMTDCSFGTTSLSVRKDNRPKRAEIEAVAVNFTLGDPFPACIMDKDPEE
ncbi:unnamed protein product [Arctia plantaginis]|uniref:Uncharacterized protein n=1 Tax=Arctia plantaginis TaxID=874455 RepID=A0A8S0YQ93_ARCPL|nr:unnamed protein product [Arctia plantaginis]